MSMAELAKLYNSLSGKSVKRFSKRAVGVDLILDAQQAQAKASPAVVRTVSRGEQAGRPPSKFEVELAQGSSSPHNHSLRGKIIEFLKSLPNARASIADLEAKFGRQVRGAVQKLMSVGWLKRG